MNFSSIEEIIEELRRGKCVVIVDDKDRENEGDLVCAAEFATPENINLMARFGRGLICLTLPKKQIQKLELPQMVQENTAQHRTAFTVSIDAIEGVSTGISAGDRSRTILTAIKDDVRPAELARPGHIFPLEAEEGGVLVRVGHTEASVDLCRLGKLKPAGVICEIMGDDGEMMRGKDFANFCDTHDLKIATIADIVEYRLRKDNLISRVATSLLPTEFGDFTIHVYSNLVDDYQHLALVKGDRIKPSDLGGQDLAEPILMRVHSECCTGDIFSSRRCDCQAQLHQSLRQIDEAGEGLLLYIRQEGRGIGLEAKINSYALQDEGQDTVEANISLGFKPDERNYGIGAQIIRDLGIHKMRLMSNNPTKRQGLQGYGLEVLETVPIEIPAHQENADYLRTKKDKMGHEFKNL
jgi:3,4-dihydroxy 2-butanone 4-phosphate synthase/GTP cyclohydrolase II